MNTITHNRTLSSNLHKTTCELHGNPGKGCKTVAKMKTRVLNIPSIKDKAKFTFYGCDCVEIFEIVTAKRPSRGRRVLV